MKTRRLGRTDIDAAVVGFGGIPIQGLSADEAETVLLRALDRGVNFFDTARGYTDSEEKMGRALAPHRDRIFLSTKAMSRTAEAMRGELETSLRRLRTDMIDLYQLHAVGSLEVLETVLGPGGALETLERAREEGKIRWIGVTGHSRPVLLEAVETDRFDTVQLPFNPIETEWSEDVLPAAAARRVGTIGMKPVAGGALRNVAASLRFILSGGIDVAIPGMDAVEQVDENCAAADPLLEPNEEELAALADERALWGEKFCRRCGYCMPCPNELNIPFLLLIEAYYVRYGLTDWALARLAGLEKRYADCTGCGACVEKCPYLLPIPELMERAAKTVV
ncbi:MAG: aldo/keto reductase [Candidatus Krumholzibacteriota bacterium]|nr:aldo/keto reductase [Candidatus Krumholzibacteriota bacterium]